VPTISEFYGITIRMFYNDHAPPHFHAGYGEYELIIGILPITVMQGNAPKRVKSMVLEWTALHQVELQENWNRCRQAQILENIEPLD
jgi:hypothetical protein